MGASRSRATVPFEAHLMLEDPDPWLQPFAAAGCDTVLVHAEACRHLHLVLDPVFEGSSPWPMGLPGTPEGRAQTLSR